MSRDPQMCASHRDGLDLIERAETLRRARTVALDKGESVGKECFAAASEGGSARPRGAVHGTSILELCCGLGGPTLDLAEGLHCSREAIVGRGGPNLYTELVDAHLQWVEWLEKGRVRTLAVHLERVQGSRCETREGKDD